MRNLKKILALVLAFVMSLSLMATASAAGTSAPGTNDYTTAQQVLTELSVFKGDYGTQDYRFDDYITRAETAALVYRIATGDVDDVQAALYTNHPFTDVLGTTSAWANGYIAYGYNAEILKGNGDSTFTPDANVTGYATLAMILRTMGYGRDHEFEGEYWEIQTAATAKQEGLLNGVTAADEARLGEYAPRGLVAQILFNALFQKTVKYNANTPYNYVKDADTLGYQKFGLEEITGVVTANEYANLGDNGLDALAANKTQLTTGSESRTLNVTSHFSDIGEARSAYVVPADRSKNNNTYTVLCSKLFDAGNVTADNEYNEKNSSDLTKAAGITADSTTQYYLNYDKAVEHTANIRISYFVNWSTPLYSNHKTYLDKLVNVTSDNRMIAVYDDNDPASIIGYIHWIPAGEKLTADDESIISDIFDNADLEKNPAGVAATNIIQGEVYVGTQSRVDYSDTKSEAQFYDENTTPNDKTVTSAANGEYLKVIDNDGDDIADYVLKTEYILTDVTSKSINGDTVYYRGIPSGSTVKYEATSGSEDYKDDVALSIGDVILSTKEIDGAYYAEINIPVTATIQTVVYATPKVTTTDGDDYLQSGITNSTGMDQLIIYMNEKTAYSLYLDKGGHIRAYTTDASDYALLTEMYPTGNYNGMYVTNGNWIVEMMTAADANPAEYTLLNSYINNLGAVENPFIDNSRTSGWWLYDRPWQGSVGHPYEYIDYLQEAIAHLGISGVNYPTTPDSHDKIDNNGDEFVWSGGNNSLTNVGRYVKADNGVYLYSASELAFRPDTHEQVYYGRYTLDGVGQYDTQYKTWKTDWIADYQTANPTANYTTAEDAWNDWVSGVNPAHEVYAVDYVQIDDTESIVAGDRMYTDKTANREVVYAVNDTQYYLVSSSGIRTFTGYSNIGAIDAKDIMAIYAVAQNTEATNKAADYWVADVIVIELVNDYNFESISLIYNNPSQTTNTTRSVQALDNKAANTEVDIYPEGYVWGNQWGTVGEAVYGFYGLNGTTSAGENAVNAQITRIRENYNAHGIYAGEVVAVRGTANRGEYISVDMDGVTGPEDTLTVFRNGGQVPVYAIGATRNQIGYSVTQMVLDPTYTAANHVKPGDKIIWVMNGSDVAYIVDLTYASRSSSSTWSCANWLINTVNGEWISIWKEQNPTIDDTDRELEAAKAAAIRVLEEARDTALGLAGDDEAKRTAVLTAYNEAVIKVNAAGTIANVDTERTAGLNEIAKAVEDTEPTPEELTVKATFTLSGTENKPTITIPSGQGLYETDGTALKVSRLMIEASNLFGSGNYSFAAQIGAVAGVPDGEWYVFELAEAPAGEINVDVTVTPVTDETPDNPEDPDDEMPDINTDWSDGPVPTGRIAGRTLAAGSGAKTVWKYQVTPAGEKPTIPVVFYAPGFELGEVRIDSAQSTAKWYVWIVTATVNADVTVESMVVMILNTTTNITPEDPTPDDPEFVQLAVVDAEGRTLANWKDYISIIVDDAELDELTSISSELVGTISITVKSEEVEDWSIGSVVNGAVTITVTLKSEVEEPDELAEAREKAVADLTTYANFVADLHSGDSMKVAKIEEALAAAKAAVEAAKTEAEIEAAVTAGEDAIDEAAGSTITDAERKEAAIKAVTEYAETVKAALDPTEDAELIEAVEAAVKAAETAINGRRETGTDLQTALDNVVTEQKEEINKAVGQDIDTVRIQTYQELVAYAEAYKTENNLTDAGVVKFIDNVLAGAQAELVAETEDQSKFAAIAEEAKKDMEGALALNALKSSLSASLTRLAMSYTSSEYYEQIKETINAANETLRTAAIADQEAAQKVYDDCADKVERLAAGDTSEVGSDGSIIDRRRFETKNGKYVLPTQDELQDELDTKYGEGTYLVLKEPTDTLDDGKFVAEVVYVATKKTVTVTYTQYFEVKVGDTVVADFDYGAASASGVPAGNYVIGDVLVGNNISNKVEVAANGRLSVTNNADVQLYPAVKVSYTGVTKVVASKSSTAPTSETENAVADGNYVKAGAYLWVLSQTVATEANKTMYILSVKEGGVETVNKSGRLGESIEAFSRQLVSGKDVDITLSKGDGIYTVMVGSDTIGTVTGATEGITTNSLSLTAGNYVAVKSGRVTATTNADATYDRTTGILTVKSVDGAENGVITLVPAAAVTTTGVTVEVNHAKLTTAEPITSGKTWIPVDATVKLTLTDTTKRIVVDGVAITGDSITLEADKEYTVEAAAGISPTINLKEVKSNLNTLKSYSDSSFVGGTVTNAGTITYEYAVGGYKAPAWSGIKDSLKIGDELVVNVTIPAENGYFISALPTITQPDDKNVTVSTAEWGEDGSVVYRITIRVTADSAGLTKDSFDKATLHDTREILTDTELSKGYSISKSANTTDDGIDYNITVTHTGLWEHWNGVDTKGYWAGFSINLGENTSNWTQVKYTWKGQSAKTTDLEDLGSGKKGIAFYYDADENRTSDVVTVSFLDAAGNESAEIVCNVTLNITKAQNTVTLTAGSSIPQAYQRYVNYSASGSEIRYTANALTDGLTINDDDTSMVHNDGAYVPVEFTVGGNDASSVKGVVCKAGDGGTWGGPAEALANGVYKEWFKFAEKNNGDVVAADDDNDDSQETTWTALSENEAFTYYVKLYNATVTENTEPNGDLLGVFSWVVVRGPAA